jgi:hypothetical protein
MGLAAGKLRKLEPDELCQSVEGDVIARIEELKLALRDERKRKQEEQGQPGEPPPPGKPRIVESVAELRALKMMQDSVTRDIGEIQKMNLPQDVKELTPLQKARLERLAHKQGTIRTMWRDFARAMGLSEEEFDKPPEADTGEEEGR